MGIWVTDAIKNSGTLVDPKVTGCLYVYICAFFSPMGRTDRRGFVRGLVLLGTLAFAVWQLLDPIADAEWISDAALVWIGQGFSVLSGFWIVALFALSARRAHDLGLSGAWGLLAIVPPINLFALALGAVLPGRPKEAQDDRKWGRKTG